MNKFDGFIWGKKVYTYLSLGVAAIIWIVFFISLFFGRLSYGPVESTWIGEIIKWVVMTIILVGLIDGISYALIGTLASRKQSGFDEPGNIEEPDVEVPVTVEEPSIVEEEIPVIEKPNKEPEEVDNMPVSEEKVIEEASVNAAEPVVKRTRKKKTVKATEE